MSASKNLVGWLSDPSHHADGPDHVEVCETHISWVFLTRQFAYKLKKPVRFPFLNFERLPSRQFACEEEVRLNRRLAPDVYLGTVPMTQSADGELALAGSGEIVDWLVKMRRLDAQRRCDVLLSRDGVTREQLSELADVLTAFYRGAPVRALEPPQNLTRHEVHAHSNRNDLLKDIGESGQAIVKRVHAEQFLFMRLFADVFQDRMCEGRVVDGHGDLRPEHVYFYSPPKIVDCIEFSPSYRIVDVCDDLCFFAMECAAMGEPAAGWQVLDECLRALGDAPPAELIDFFMSYRACVRAKIVLCGHTPARLDQVGSTEKVLHYLHVAEAHPAVGGPPWLIVVCGGVGTGKSTLARYLAGNLGFDHLQTDVLRRRRFGLRGCEEDIDEGIYSPANRLQVYHELFQLAAHALDKCVSVVVDGSFQLNGAWHELERILPHTRARVLVVHCRCSPDLARRRIEQRLASGSTESEARPEMVQDATAMHVTIPEHLQHVRLDTANETSSLAECVYSKMRAMLDNGRYVAQ
jgi:aminoglycoside phosphotransferase family enzyme/predicted kinase